MLPTRRLVPWTVVLASGVAAAQRDCLDQVYVPNPATNGLEVTANQPVTQTFTVGRSGQLTRIELALINQHRGLPWQPLQVDVVLTDASGVPTPISLASITVPPANVPATRGPLEIDLSSFNVQVQRSQVLGIALSSTAAPSTQTYAWWGEAPGGSYPRGIIYIRGTTALPAWDLAFRTWVSAPASWTNYGTGHPGSNGIPSLTAAADPIIGTNPALLIGNSRGTATAGALFVGAAQANLPTPFGGTLLLQIAASLPLALAAGGGQVQVPIPPDHRLCGFSVYAQAVLADPGASQGIAFSPGLELVLGG